MTPAPNPAAAEPRELSTDRPDATESPYSVPAGWFQLEMDGVVWTRNSEKLYETRRLGLAPLNLKLGLTGATDLQVVFEPWARTRVTFEGYCPAVTGTLCGSGTGTTTGTGELAVRLKWNLFGNDGGRVALGLLPWVAWDTSARGDGIADAAGLAIPVAVSLGERWGMGAMIEGSGGGDERAFLGTATLAHDFGGSVGAFGELTAEYVRNLADDSDATLANANSGLTVGLGPDLQLDAGVRVGLTRATDDFTMFAGFAYRRPLR